MLWKQVSISPEVASKKFSREIVSKLIQDLEPYLRNKIPAYDGTKTLYTAEPLQPNLLGTHVVDIKQQRRDSCETSTIKFQQFSVTLKGGTKVETQNLQKFLDGRFSDCPHHAIQMLNIVLHAAKLPTDYVRIGRSIFKFLPESLGEGVELLRGYYQSIRPTQVGLSLNMDVSAQPFYKSIQVDDFVSEYLNLNLEELSSPLSDANCEKVKRALKGIIVETEHLAYRKCYKVIGMSSEPADKLMFSYGSTGTQSIQLSVSAYFKDKYKIELKHPALPCIQTGRPDKLIYLPMQVCKIVQGQKYLKKLNKGQMDALLDKTRQEPHHRESIITEMVRTSKYSKNQIVKDFGMDISEVCATVDARVLPPPMLKYYGSGPEGEIAPSRGRWNMKGKKMYRPVTVDRWTCLNFSSSMEQHSVKYFCNELVSMCNRMGMRMRPYPYKEIRFVRPDLIEDALSEVCSTSKCNESLQLLIIILPAVTGFYGKIKRICETKLGIVSQCCQPKHPKDIRDQYLANLALKINVKAGGRNTVLCDAMQKHIPPLTDDVTIIFGADVTHAQPGEDSSASIAAVVASMDWPEVSKYRGAFHAQRHRVEIIENLHACVRELLIAFLDANENEKPERIIFYRDGVSEGQFAEVLSHEVDMIRQACKSIDEKYQPSITFVVVQKRHNTRFFLADDIKRNIRPGTVVDTKTCHPSEFDFYLCSHEGIQGTSRPTHYHVLCDENKFTADLLQLLTYSLCYTFARCTQSVSVVPPAYYAHLLAFRARHYLEDMTMSEDDGGSTTVKDITKDKPAVIQSLPKIMENLKDVMFYC